MVFLGAGSLSLNLHFYWCQRTGITHKIIRFKIEALLFAKSEISGVLLRAHSVISNCFNFWVFSDVIVDLEIIVILLTQIIQILHIFIKIAGFHGSGIEIGRFKIAQIIANSGMVAIFDF